MVQIDVQLRGILRDVLPARERGRTTVEMEEGATIADLMERLDIKRRAAAMINEKHKADSDTILHDGDRVVFFTILGGG